RRAARLRLGASDRAGGGLHGVALRFDRARPRVGAHGALMEAIEHPPIFRLPGIPDQVTYTWLVMIILAGLTFAASRNLQLGPRGLRNLLERVREQVQ